MQFGFLKRKQEAKLSQQAGALEVYRKLIGTAADLGDLSDEDGEALLEAAETIGLPFETSSEDEPSVTGHAALIARAKELEKQTAGLQKAEKRASKAGEDLAAFNRETDAILNQRRLQAADLENAWRAASYERDAVQAVEADLRIARSRIRDYEKIIEAGASVIPDIQDKWKRYQNIAEGRERALGSAGGSDASLTAKRELAHRIESEEREALQAANSEDA